MVSALRSYLPLPESLEGRERISPHGPPHPPTLGATLAHSRPTLCPHGGRLFSKCTVGKDQKREDINGPVCLRPALQASSQEGVTLGLCTIARGGPHPHLPGKEAGSRRGWSHSWCSSNAGPDPGPDGEMEWTQPSCCSSLSQPEPLHPHSP